jgi:hypothetical protein
MPVSRFHIARQTGSDRNNHAKDTNAGRSFSSTPAGSQDQVASVKLSEKITEQSRWTWYQYMVAVKTVPLPSH